MKPTWVRWRIILVLFVAGFVGYLLRTNLSVAGDAMMKDLGLTKVQLGQVMAAFAWGYGLFQIPGGLYGDRVGGRRSLAVMALWWFGFNLLMGLVPGSGVTRALCMLIGLRFLMGVAQAGLFPVTGALIFHWFPPTGRALPNAVGNAGLTLGAAATGPLIAWLVQEVGWRMSFAVTSPLALLVAGLWWWYGRDRPEQHAAVNHEEIKLIRAGYEPPSEEPAGALPGPEQPDGRVGGDTEQIGWLRLLANRNVLLITLSYFCSNYCFYFFFNWLYIYLVDVRGLSQLSSGWFAAAPWLTGAVGALIGGSLCDRMTDRFGIGKAARWLCLGSLLAAAGFLLAGSAASDAHLAVLLLSLCLGFQQMAEGPFWAATIAVTGKHAGTGCGILNSGGNLVGGVGALVVPMMAEGSGGWPAALGAAAVVCAVGALLWLGINADQEV